jgi:hypothetical protein
MMIEYTLSYLKNGKMVKHIFLIEEPTTAEELKSKVLEVCRPEDRDIIKKLMETPND